LPYLLPPTFACLTLTTKHRSQINNPDPTVFSSATTRPPSHRNYTGGFITALAHKDLALAVNAAAQSGTPLRLGKCAEQVYRPLAKSEEWGGKDFSVIYKVLEELGAEGRESRL
jgi:3-hydroxyisobutyrate dehydrogenase